MIDVSQNIIDIIRLINSENVSNATFFNLVDIFGSPASALSEGIPYIIKKSKKSDYTFFSQKDAETEIELCNKNNVKIIPYTSPNYPHLLHYIDDKPPILYAKGNVDLLKKVSVAIVGTRHPSLNGLKIATNLAKELGDAGLLITSGLAIGIDRAAHEASINTGTVAFLGSGLGHIYPTQNRDLYQRMFQQGLVMSEFRFNTKPLSYNFPKRNRLISGISSGILVVEASQKSGSIITAKIALEQNKDIFAVPANPNDINSQGTNMLIKEGAYLVETADDLKHMIERWHRDFNTLKEQSYEYIHKQLHISKTDQSDLFKYTQNYTNNVEPSIHSNLLGLLSHTPISVNLIARELGINSKELQVNLVEMELQGSINRLPGNKVSL